MDRARSSDRDAGSEVVQAPDAAVPGGTLRFASQAIRGITSRAEVLALQHAAGNRAVARALRSDGRNRPAGSRLPIQLMRFVQGNVLGMSIDSSWATALTDDELADQLRIVRQAAAGADDDATRQTARENLQVLEQEAATRNPHGSSPAPNGPPAAGAQPQTASPGGAPQGGPGPGSSPPAVSSTLLALVGPPLALGLAGPAPVTPTPPLGPPPALPPPTITPPTTAPPPAWEFRPPPRIAPPLEPPVRPWWIPSALGSAVIVGLIVFLWPNETAPPWMDTLNPITGGPYASREEYDQISRMNPNDFAEAVRRHRQQAAPQPAPPQPQPNPAPQPQPGPRRNPNQTCDDAVLDQLQADKDRICNAIPGESCSPSKVSPKRLERRPCSEIRARIQAVRDCIAIRQRIQNECFGGAPDPVHQRVMNELNSGLQACLALEAINCAPGHPMANL